MDSSGLGASTASSSRDASRYAYLVGRLRNKQITMSEATELFEMQQATLAAALASGSTPPPPPPPPDAASYGSTTPGAPAPTTPAQGPSDDMFWMGMLAVGAGAGVLAALLRRSQKPDPALPAPPSAAQSRTP